MTLYVDDKFNIFLYQGDSGELIVENLPEDKDYDVFLSIRNKDNKLVIDEISVKSNFNNYVTFILTSELTSLLKIPTSKEYECYFYGLKLCDEDGNEDTVFVGNSDFGVQNMIFVYPQKVEGGANE